MTELETGAGDLDIAVVGMAARFPGAPDLDALWALLAEGRDTTSRFTEEEYVAAGGRPDRAADPYLVRVESALEGIDLFDSGYFGYPPAEAEALDPQSRLFLECAHHALDDAGWDPARHPGPIGVFAGSGANRYFLFHVFPRLAGRADSLELLQASFSSSASSFATRVAYDLGLTGPAVTVQTACSTSLVAVHLACQQLLAYQCDTALAGGATVNPMPRQGYRFVEGGPLSRDGRCRAFDAAADGMFPGDGAGAVVLRRLADALADGDQVYAVIKGSAVNNDGRRKIGYTAPSVPGQAEVIVAAQTVAEVDADSIGLVEAHGTATPLGDPIEVRALTSAFRRGTDRTGFCALGSVKTNLGHTDSAAGVAGLLKAVLALRHGAIPASLHFREPNPLIDFADSPFYVPTELTPWPAGDRPRRAAVSSFGIGGTNAHVILEEAAPPAPAPGRDRSLLVLAAATPAALAAAATELAGHLDRHPDLPLDDVAHTLQVGRRELPHRRVVVADSTAAAATLLRVPAPPAPAAAETAPPLVFLFPGLGAHHPGMGRELYDTEPEFRVALDRCAAVLRDSHGVDLLGWLHRAESADVPLSSVGLVATEYALATLLGSLGLRPAATAGHSLGEFTAACVAGVLPLDDLLPLVVERERLFLGTEPGAMLGVSADPDTLRLPGRLTVAAVNGGGSCLLSGPVADAETLERELLAAGVECRRLTVGFAAHSALLDPALDRYADAVARVRLSPPQVPYVTGVTGDWVDPARVTDPAHWRDHAREPVLFSAVLDTLVADGEPVLVEVGPGHSLGSLVRRHQPDRAPVVATMRHPRAEQPDRAVLLDAVGQLWTRGVPVDWTALHLPGRRRVSLPGYPFQRRRHWIPAASLPSGSAAGVPGLATGAPDSLSGTPASPTSPARELVRTEWLPARVPEPAADTGPWRVLGDRGELAAALAARLPAGDGSGGAGVVVVVDHEDHGRCAEGLAEIGAAATAAARVVVAVRGSGLCPLVEGLGAAVTRVDLPAGGEPARSADLLAREALAGTRADRVSYVDGHRRVREPRPVAAATAAAVPTLLVADGLGDTALPLTRAAATASGGPLFVTGTAGSPGTADPAGVTGTSGAASTASVSAGVPLGAPADEVTRAVRVEERLRSEIAVERMPPDLEHDLDRLCAAYVSAYLRQSGVPTTAGARLDPAATADRLGIRPGYRRFWQTFLQILAEDGILRPAGDGLEFATDAADETELARLRDGVLSRHPDWSGDLAVLQRAADAFGPVLRGEVAGTEVLMPGGGLESVQDVIDNRTKSSDIAVYIPLVGELVADWAGRERPGRRLRVVEIGGGGGHLTWPVMDAVRAAGVEIDYRFTDIGRSFVLAAQRQAASRGLDMGFGVLDVSRDPAPQGFPAGCADVVVAFNVLHATPDLRTALRHCRSMLAPGGALVVLEAARPRRWSTLVSGLFEGWWYFDDDVRELSPLLPAEEWVDLLAQEGFEHPAALPIEAADRAIADHALLLAGSPAHPSTPSDAIAAEVALAGGDARVTVVAPEGGGLRAAGAEVLLASWPGTAEPEDDPGRAVTRAGEVLDEVAELARTAGVESVLVVLPPDAGGATAAAAEAWAAALTARWSDGDGPAATLVRWDPAGVPADEAADLLRRILAEPPGSMLAVTTPAIAPQDSAPDTPAASAFNARPALATPYRAPASETETEVVRVWEEVLGIDGIGADDNFFDLGGDSLLAMRLVARLRDEHGLDLPMGQVFETPTAAGVAGLLATARTGPPAPAGPVIPRSRARRTVTRAADGRIAAPAGTAEGGDR